MVSIFEFNICGRYSGHLKSNELGCGLEIKLERFWGELSIEIMDREKAETQTKSYEEKYIEGKLQSVIGKIISEIDTTEEGRERLRKMVRNHQINK